MIAGAPLLPQTFQGITSLFESGVKEPQSAEPAQ
jgi:hypothetical protein